MIDRSRLWQTLFFSGFWNFNPKIHRPTLHITTSWAKKVDNQWTSFLRQISHGSEVGSFPGWCFRRLAIQRSSHCYFHNSGKVDNTKLETFVLGFIGRFFDNNKYGMFWPVFGCCALQTLVQIGIDESVVKYILKVHFLLHL